MKKPPTSKGFLLAALMLSTLILGAFNADPGFAAPAATSYATVITVNSSADLNNSESNTCISHTPCTLRRAVVQARSATKPVLIQFDIPTTDLGYDSALNIWRIEFLYYSSTANATLRYLNGEITIDGSTQPGGRTTGPRIILVGPAAERDGIRLGETATQNANQIIGLGFQNFKTHIYVNSSNNLVKDNWFGLSDDGTDIALRAGGEDSGSGNTGVSVMTGANTNMIQNNVFAGLAGVAASIIGDSNTFANNRVGTRADGTVPDLFPSLVCSQWDWLGGSGISMDGQGNLIENNIFAGLRIAVEPPTIQADTIRVGNDNHIIRNNQIGVDSANSEVGVCGRGIFLQGGTEFNQVTSNIIVNSGYSAISLNDTPVVSTSDANTLRGNVIKKNTPWGEIEDNNSPEDAIQITKSLPDAFRNFNPAKITAVNGLIVTGTNGDNSPCPNCIIEVFLDDMDAITEALQSLAVVNADASGNWTATLPTALGANQRLRTTSTTTIHNTIAGMSTGTTTGLSGEQPNLAPTGIALSASSVLENKPAATLVGNLTATDPNTSDTFTYALSTAAGCAATNNASFQIVGAALKTKAVFDFETKNSYIVCIRVTDGGGLTFNKSFTIKVTNAVDELAKNGGFETYTGASKIPTNWAQVGFGTLDGKNTSFKTGKYAVKIANTVAKSKTLTQTLSIPTGAAAQKFTFSYWVKGTTLPSTGLCQGQVLLYNGSSTTPNKTVTLSCGKTGTFAYTLRTITFTTTAPFTKVVIKFTYSKANSSVWFDVVSLKK